MQLPQTVAMVPSRTLLRYFVAFFALAAATLTLAIAVVVRLDAKDHLEKTQVRESARIEIARVRMLQDLSSVAFDLNVIAKLPAMQRFLDSRATVQREELTRFFLLLSGESGRYDQIRFLDMHGQEVIRINHNNGHAYVVPQAELQNKAGRYFFRDTLKLGEGEIFVSPLDLNIEHDQLEIPYKPMMRFGMPVFDSRGRKQGVILLNYFGSQLLQHFRDVMRGGDTRVPMLLNRDGFWLSGMNPEDEWGFMLKRPERVFASDFPAEWNTIAAHDNGSLQTNHGLFMYGTVYPLQAGQHSSSGSSLPRAPSQHELGAEEYQWKIVTFVPAAILQERNWFRHPGNRLLILAAYLLLALAAAIVAFFNLRHRQSADSLKENETRLREITNTMSDGLIVIDKKARILFANPEASLLLGYTPTELLHTDMHDLLHVAQDGSPAPRTECPVLDICHSGKTYRGEEEMFKRKDGSVMPVSISASAMQRNKDMGDIVIAFHDISERKKLEHELEQRAHTDVLTGLSNRRHFYVLAEQEVSRARRYGTPLSALMLDIDHFKKINDTHGHHVGDSVLQKLSEVCRNTLRENDIVGRLGGEEFAILLPETGSERALEVAERLRQAVADSHIPLPGNGHIRFFISIGVTSMITTDESVDSLLRRADTALYASKHGGRNRVSSEFVEMAGI